MEPARPQYLAETCHNRHDSGISPDHEPNGVAEATEEQEELTVVELLISAQNRAARLACDLDQEGPRADDPGEIATQLDMALAEFRADALSRALRADAARKRETTKSDRAEDLVRRGLKEETWAALIADENATELFQRLEIMMRDVYFIASSLQSVIQLVEPSRSTFR